MTTKRQKPKLLIICGPTASGKSAFAINIATNLNGAIINADSMQIYREIPIITASPSIQDKATIPHYLYNYISVHEEFSAARYLTDATIAIKKASDLGLLPIIVGGTGLYISALLGRLSHIPHIDQTIRRKARAAFEQMGREDFYHNLIKLDPSSAKLTDAQRMMRSYEVLLQTGHPISYYQNRSGASILDGYDISIIMLQPERNFLHQCCKMRFESLIELGALDEARFMSGVTTSAQKALGLRELQAYLRGEISLEDAINLAIIKTRQYAKRQLTWFNNQIENKEILEFSSTRDFENLIDLARARNHFSIASQKAMW